MARSGPLCFRRRGRLERNFPVGSELALVADSGRCADTLCSSLDSIGGLSQADPRWKPNLRSYMFAPEY